MNVQGHFQGESAVSLQLLGSTRQAGVMGTSQEHQHSWENSMRASSSCPEGAWKGLALAAAALPAPDRFLQDFQNFSEVLRKSHFRAEKRPGHHRLTPGCLIICKQSVNASQGLRVNGVLFHK